ncbi:hypothetical protein, partial [Escherichia coli]|uniref:hypothetical protein n=1 Tax=Escherichia coli TaxID=562 RepID=UPI0019334FEC
ENQGLTGASKRLKRSWEDMQKALGGKIFTDNVGQIDKVTEAIGRLNELSKETSFNFSDLMTKPGKLFGLAVDTTKAAFGIGR